MALPKCLTFLQQGSNLQKIGKFNTYNSKPEADINFVLMTFNTFRLALKYKHNKF